MKTKTELSVARATTAADTLKAYNTGGLKGTAFDDTNDFSWYKGKADSSFNDARDSQTLKDRALAVFNAALYRDMRYARAGRRSLLSLGFALEFRENYEVSRLAHDYGLE